MSDRSDQEMRDLAATATRVVDLPATGHERVGDFLVTSANFLFWSAIWFYVQAGKAERQRKRDQDEGRP
jgi:hypothetical protein